MTNIVHAIAKPRQPMEVFKALEALVQETIGAKLFTIMEIDYVKGIAKRSYTNMPKAYPVAGEKPLRQDAWSAQIQQKHQTFVANTIDEITDVFSDYVLIQSLGCESCMNIPIVVADRVIGTLNCLHDAGHYTSARVEAAKQLEQAGALALLVARVIHQGDVHA